MKKWETALSCALILAAPVGFAVANYMQYRAAHQRLVLSSFRLGCESAGNPRDFCASEAIKYLKDHE